MRRISGMNGSPKRKFKLLLSFRSYYSSRMWARVSSISAAMGPLLLIISNMAFISLGGAPPYANTRPLFSLAVFVGLSALRSSELRFTVTFGAFESFFSGFFSASIAFRYYLLKSFEKVACCLRYSVACKGLKTSVISLIEYLSSPSTSSRLSKSRAK